MTDPNAERWLAELAAERSKFTLANKLDQLALIHKLIECGEYPQEWNGKPIDVWQRVQGWGAYWHRFSEPLECPACKADLRDREWGPPGSRLIGLSDGDSIHTWCCPDCKAQWPRQRWAR